MTNCCHQLGDRVLPRHPRSVSNSTHYGEDAPRLRAAFVHMDVLVRKRIASMSSDSAVALLEHALNKLGDTPSREDLSQYLIDRFAVLEPDARVQTLRRAVVANVACTGDGSPPAWLLDYLGAADDAPRHDSVPG